MQTHHQNKKRFSSQTGVCPKDAACFLLTEKPPCEHIVQMLYWVVPQNGAKRFQIQTLYRREWVSQLHRTACHSWPPTTNTLPVTSGEPTSEHDTQYSCFQDQFAGNRGRRRVSTCVLPQQGPGVQFATSAEPTQSSDRHRGRMTGCHVEP